MAERNREEYEDGPADGRRSNGVAVVAEGLRAGSEAGTSPARGEERVSLFWRVCGGAVLSVTAMVLVTVYQQFSNGLHDLRTDLNRLNEARGDLVKKDELNSRTASLWGTIRDIQAAGAATTALKERATLLEQQVKAGEKERKELVRELQRLRERLAVLEGKQAATPAARPRPREP